MFDGFETELPSGTDENGIPIGFQTYKGPASKAIISRTTAHPPLPGETAGNNVLRIDLDINDWAGFLHNFENASVDT